MRAAKIRFEKVYAGSVLLSTKNLSLLKKVSGALAAISFTPTRASVPPIQLQTFARAAPTFDNRRETHVWQQHLCAIRPCSSPHTRSAQYQDAFNNFAFVNVQERAAKAPQSLFPQFFFTKTKISIDKFSLNPLNTPALVLPGAEPAVLIPRKRETLN